MAALKPIPVFAKLSLKSKISCQENFPTGIAGPAETERPKPFCADNGLMSISMKNKMKDNLFFNIISRSHG